MEHLLDNSTAALQAWCADHGEPAYRARQVHRWLFEGRAVGFEAMSDLPKWLRATLAESFAIWTSEIAAHKHAADGTEKLLLRLLDGHTIECVLLRDGARRTICISTQVGCAMGCVFCASGLDGVIRNLTTGEIVEQMLRLQACLAADERLSHIVVMGMGEPLANLDRLLPALAEATSPDGLGISARRITISTVGLPAAIDRLAAEDIHYHLAVSLHAADDELRSRLVPVNQKIGLAAVMAAADRYFERTGRRVTYEYVLLGDVNDRHEDARRMADLLANRNALLNVIPYNEVAGLGYTRPGAKAIERFRTTLEAAGVQVQVRQRKGHQIDAACGQLRRSLGDVALPIATPTTAST